LTNIVKVLFQDGDVLVAKGEVTLDAQANSLLILTDDLSYLNIYWPSVFLYKVLPYTGEDEDEEEERDLL